MVVSAELNVLILLVKKDIRKLSAKAKPRLPPKTKVTTKKAQSDESQGVVSSTQGLMLISSDCNWTQLRI